MVPQGRVEHGAVVLFDCVPLPKGQLVTVQSSPANSEAMPDNLGSLRQNTDPATVSKERQEALRQLIGICKTDTPPDDEQVEQILEIERMKKYG
jgi:hypothetical protein